MFGTKNLTWQVAPWQEESCDPSVTETYRDRFPQLWEDHDLIVRFERTEEFFSPSVGQGSWSANHPRVSHSRIYEDVAKTMIPNLADQEPSRTRTQGSEQFTKFTSKDARFSEISAQERLGNDPQVIEPLSELLRAQGYVLRLFVSGNSVTTENTLKTLHQLLEKSLVYPYTLKVIDVFKHPEQAEANQISATPTLLRVWPSPVRRIVGGLDDVEKVLRVLEAPSSRG
ncbi:circadian clock KaiB family protein [Lyngbya aestuarii]|uniref:circadian clock KaiB family protein n=1 Tax=Lyngbya aestuarii TaxID=118322 RepID=UPI00403E3602